MSGLIRTSIALAAVAATFVVSAVAFASPVLTHPTGTTLAVGSSITGTGNGNALLTIPGAASVECDETTITGKLLKNTGTHIEGEISAAEFRGTPGEKTPTEKMHCSSSIGNVNVTPTMTSNGPIHNNISSLPWCITANDTKDTFTMTGGKCGSPRPLTFALAGIFLCKYERASVTGKYTTHPADAVLTINEQEFVEIPGTALAACPNSGKLDVSVTLETDDAGNKPIYIS
jgi:hypothetical protein